MSGTAPVGVRIGELSRRVGVSPELLRAWERRYGLLEPLRSTGGYRLYSPSDELRVRRMLRHLERGFSAAEAAALTMRGDERSLPDQADELDGLRRDLREALDGLDDAAAHAVLDRLLASHAVERCLSEVLLPLLREIGTRWARGDVTVGQEHFASSLLVGRLHGLARRWSHGIGPLAILACPSGERHELGLLCFGLTLRGRGWRVAYLGADTPSTSLRDAVQRLRPEIVVLAAMAAGRFATVVDDLGALARECRLAIGGAGAGRALAERLGAELLEPDPIHAALTLHAG